MRGRLTRSGGRIDEMHDRNRGGHMKRHHMKSGMKRVTSIRLRDWHHSRDAGGKPSSAASPNSADRRGSSGSRTRSDDKGVCADGGPHGLRLGVASRLCVQPAHGAHEGSRNGSPRRRPAYRSDESGRDADRLHQSCRDLHRHPEPGCRVRVGLAVSRKGAGGHSSARLW